MTTLLTVTPSDSLGDGVAPPDGVFLHVGGADAVATALTLVDAVPLAVLTSEPLALEDPLGAPSVTLGRPDAAAEGDGALPLGVGSALPDS